MGTCSCTTLIPEGGVVPLEDFLPYVQMYVPGCPDEIVAHAIRLEAIELSRTAHVIRRTILVDAQAHVGDYCLEVSDGYRIAAIDSVCVDGIPHRPLTQPLCSGQHVRGAYYFEPPSTLLIYEAPERDGEKCIQVVASVQPSQDTCFLDRRLYDDYAEALANGAISRLLLMPETKWFDRTNAGIFMRKARQSMVRAKNLAMKGNSTGPTFMRTRRRFV